MDGPAVPNGGRVRQEPVSPSGPWSGAGPKRKSVLVPVPHTPPFPPHLFPSPSVCVALVVVEAAGTRLAGGRVNG